MEVCSFLLQRLTLRKGPLPESSCSPNLIAYILSACNSKPQYSLELQTHTSGGLFFTSMSTRHLKLAYAKPPGEVCWAVNINNNLHTQTHEFYTLPPSSLFFERASFWSPRNRSCWNFSLALQSSRALSEAS